METIKAINEWGFQIMFLVLWCASSAWSIAATVHGIRWGLAKLAKAAKHDADDDTTNPPTATA